MKLLLKMLGWLVPLVLVPLLAVAILAYQTVQQITFEQAHSELKKITDDVGYTVTSATDRAASNLDMISNDTLIQEYLRARDAERYSLYQAPVLRRFKALQLAYPEYQALQLHLASGDKTVSRRIDDTALAPDELNNAIIEQLRTAENALPMLQVPDTFSPEKPWLIVGKRVEGRLYANNPGVLGTLGYLLASVDGKFLQQALDESAKQQGARTC